MRAESSLSDHHFEYHLNAFMHVRGVRIRLRKLHKIQGDGTQIKLRPSLDLQCTQWFVDVGKDVSMANRAVIFDYYGTLAFLDAGRRSMWQTLSRQLNIASPVDEIDRRWLATAATLEAEVLPEFVTLTESWRRRAAELFRQLDVDGDGSMVSDLYNDVHAKAVPFADVTSCLTELRLSYKIALLSNADASHLLPSLESASLVFDAERCLFGRVTVLQTWPVHLLQNVPAA